MISLPILAVLISLAAPAYPRHNVELTYNGLTKPSSSVSVGGLFDAPTTRQKFGRRSRHRRQDDSETMNKNLEDHHLYYTSRYVRPGAESDGLWFELGDLIGSGEAEVQNNVTDSILQGFHRSYEIWDLKFDFPYYGHIVNSLAVTTGGFLYTGTFIHNRVHLTQFIAPLQADFNPSINDDSRIFIYNTVDRFTAQWNEVHNHDHVNAGVFTFQVSLFPNGTIHFVYKKIPLLVPEINNDDHPVEVGLADAFYYDVFQGPFRIRYIYEYSRVQLNASTNLSYSAYIINPVPNCVVATNCTECSGITELGNFQCSWCPNINRCSDGLDRFTQQWIDNGCLDEAITCDIISSSPASSSPSSSPSVSSIPVSPTGPPVVTTGRASSSSLSDPAKASIGMVLFVVVLVLIAVSVVIGVLIYGYKRPHSKIGMFMIEHRPSARSLNKTAKYDFKTEKVLLE